MLTLPANWIAAFSRGYVSPVVLVVIKQSEFSSYKFTSQVTSLGYPVSVANVAQVSSKLDPLERSTKVSSMEVQLIDDDATRSMIKNMRIMGRGISVLLGDVSLDESDYAPLFAGVCVSAYPEHGKITINCEDAFTYAMRQDYYRALWGKHPLEVISTVAVDLGVPSEFVDSAALSISAYPDISHYVYNSDSTESLYIYANLPDWPFPMPGKFAAVKAQSLFDGLAKMMLGSCYVDEQGRITYKHFDTSRSIAAAFTTQEILLGSFKQIPNTELTINRFEFSFSSVGVRGESQGSVYTVDEPSSQSSLSFPGTSSFISSKGITWPIHVGSSLVLAELTHYTTLFPIRGITGSFSGTKAAVPSASQNALYKISPTRPLYLKLDDEVMKVVSHPVYDGNRTRWAPTTNVRGIVNGGAEKLPDVGYVTIDTRGALGTSAVGHGRNEDDTSKTIFDISPMVRWADIQLERFSFGARMIEFETGLDQYALQVGDFVTVVYPDYLDYSVDGLTADTIWEVIGKEVDPMNNRCAIKWTLCWATVNGIEFTTKTHSFAGSEGRSLNAAMESMLSSRVLATSSPINGLDVTSPSGLDVVISEGAIVRSGSVRNVFEHTITLEPSSDSYLYTNDLSGQTVVVSVASGDPPGEITEGLIRLARVTTDATAVTEIVDMRQSQGPIGPYQVTSDSWIARRVLNGDFEFQTKGSLQPPDRWLLTAGTWGTDAYVSRSTKFTGGQCLEFPVGASDVELQASDYIPIRPSTGYALSFAVHSNADSDSFTPKLDWYDADYALISTSSGSTVFSRTSWGAKRYEVTSPAGASFVGVRLVKESSATAIVHLDDVDLFELPPAFRAVKSATQSVSASTLTKVQYNLESYDYWGNYDAATSYQFVAPVDGVYTFSASANVLQLDAGEFAFLRIRINSTITIEEQRVYSSAANQDVTVQAVGGRELSAGDTVDVMIFHNHASALDVTSGRFAGQQIR
jgi:hypothetical protein